MKKHLRIGWLLVFAVPILVSATASPNTGDPTRLSVSGQGYSAQSSETLTISASSSTVSQQPALAMRANAAVLERLRETLAKEGVSARDVTTRTFRFNRSRDPDDPRSSVEWGYEVRQELIVFVRDIDNAGPAIDALVEAGADGISIDNRRTFYGERLDPEVQSEARKAAVRDAQAKAADYAEALGMRISRVVSVNDGGVRMTGGPAPAARALADVETHIDNGERAVVASVNVQFELEPIE